MKKLLLSLLLFFFGQSLIAQQSKINFSNNELLSLGKTWGYLKYHHPTISQGKLPWDSLLIVALTAPKKQMVSDVVSSWLKQAQQLKSAPAQPMAPIAYDSVDYRNFSIDWIKKDQFLTANQKSALLDLNKTTNVIGTFYSYGANGRYGLKNEKDYPDSTAAYRLLGLFRFWNVIEYFYPYKYAIGKPWDDALKKFIPLAINANNELAMAKLAAELSTSLNDTHAVVTPTPFYKIFGKFGPPFKFKVINNLVVITKIVDAEICKQADLEPSDIIGKINGEFVKDIIAQKSKYLAASNNAVQTRDAFYYLFNSDNPKFTVSGQKKSGIGFSKEVIRVKRNYDNEWDRDGSLDNKLIYYDDKAKKLVYSRVLEGNIGYVERSSIVNTEIDSLMQVMQNTKGIIFDLRGYNNDGNGMHILNYFLPKPVMYGIKTQPDFAKPGTFIYMNHIAAGKEPIVTIGKINPNPYRGKVVCLINEATQSAEEMWAMLYKTIPNVTFVGSQTAGADGNKTPVKFIGPYHIYMSGAGIFYPNGTETQRVGIVSDIEVKPTVKDLQEERDVLVEKAIAIINAEK